MPHPRRTFALAPVIFFLAVSSATPARITPPRAEFGFDVGEDYRLIDYTQLCAYWRKLAAESDRMTLVNIGRSAEGRTMLMAVITSPENQRRLEVYKRFARRLALAEGLTETEARRLAAEGRAVVWIDGGLHATEVAGSQHLAEMAYQMASRQDAETRRFLRDDILLLACPNPDGLELVARWYMRQPDPLQRTTRGLPRLYQKYIGHDNNRDFYMVTQPETEAVNRVLYREWFPQIVYNHHQSGPAGTVLFAPPFRNPFNYRFDPLVPVGIDLVAAAMHNRFISEDKPGATMRSGAPYSTWWNGGLRSTAYFHNVIGILTEIIGDPTPGNIPFLPERLLPGTDLPDPITPQEWHFRQTIEYLLTADRAILDVASRHREDFLYRIYLMGRNSIERGSRDTWTIQPGDIAAVEERMKADRVPPPQGYGQGYPPAYFDELRRPEKRDPRGYILPAGQPDFLTAGKFVNALIKNGIAVERAVRAFSAGGRDYPAGSYVIKTAQAYRPHILSMFEPQDHPHDAPCPGGPPTPPYDSAGWTLAFQMGVEFDRLLETFDGPFEEVPDLVRPAPGRVTGGPDGAGYFLSHRVNDGFRAVNRLLAAGEAVYWLDGPPPGPFAAEGPGGIYIPSGPNTRGRLEAIATELGLDFAGLETRPSGKALKLRPVRIGVWDQYGGSMSAGWMRWLLEQFEFPFRLVYVPTLDEGNLNAEFDVLIFAGGGVPRPASPESAEERYWRRFQEPPDPQSVPEEYRGQIGSPTLDKTLPRLREFLAEGGTILALGRATDLAYELELPLANALTEKSRDGSETPLPREKYYIPGSVLRARVNNTQPVAFGLPEDVDVFFNNSPVFRLLPEAFAAGVKPVAWFDSPNPLRSGWAWGQSYLQGGTAVVDAAFGRGRLLLYGPEVIFRGQPHGTFKLLFNGIYGGSAEPVSFD
jgi:hypothetical protein